MMPLKAAPIGKHSELGDILHNCFRPLTRIEDHLRQVGPMPKARLDDPARMVLAHPNVAFPTNLP
jgi:hypothetical protein